MPTHHARHLLHPHHTRISTPSSDSLDLCVTTPMTKARPRRKNPHPISLVAALDTPTRTCEMLERHATVGRAQSPSSAPALLHAEIQRKARPSVDCPQGGAREEDHTPAPVFCRRPSVRRPPHFLLHLVLLLKVAGTVQPSHLCGGAGVAAGKVLNGHMAAHQRAHTLQLCNRTQSQRSSGWGTPFLLASFDAFGENMRFLANHRGKTVSFSESPH